MSLMWNFICIFARKIFNYMPMDNRNTVQLNSFVGCLGNSSATGLKNQMKESKASERKTTQQSLFFHLLFLCALFMITSCSGSRQYDFKSSEDALKQYQAFFQTMKGHSDSDAEHLADFINQWREYGDTVLNYIRKDPSFNAHSGLSMKYDLISDSIRTELLAMTGNCTLIDVAYVKLHTSLYKDNKELGSLKENAIKFFATLDQSPAYDLEVHKALVNYSKFLLSTKSHGIKSRKELVAFLHLSLIHI